MGKPEKQGIRIGRLDNNTLGYYRRVADTLSESFQNEEEKAIFLENVFKQLCHEALPVSQNQTASRIVESLLHEADQEQLLSVALVFQKDWETAITDRFASHVTQTLLLNSRKQLYDSSLSDDNEDDDENMLTVFMELHRFLMDNLAVHMQHTYTSHIVRVVMEILGGVQVSDKIIKSKVAMHGPDSKQGAKEKQFKGAPPKQFQTYLIDMINKIVNMQKFSDHARNQLSNPVIQTLLLVLKEVDEKDSKKVCKKIIAATSMFTNEDEEVPAFLTDQTGSRLAEQVVHVASDKLFDKIVTEHLSGHFVKLARHPIANFVLQRLLETSRTKEQFELIFKELEDSIEDILAHNCVGVVVAMAEGALQHSTKQEKLVKILMKAFHCYKPEERQLKVTPLLATLTTYDVFYNVKDDESDSDSKEEDSKNGPAKKIAKINLHGSVLLQKLLRFGNPRLVVSSLLEMDASELGKMACDPCGSHIMDAFVSSQTVGEKNRVSLLKKFKGLLFELATNKHGSRTLENLWNAATVEQRASMVEELLKYNDRLRSHMFGKFIHRNFALYHYQHRKQEWRNIQTGNIKKRKMFQELLDKDKGSKKAKVASGDEEDEGIQMSEEQQEAHSTTDAGTQSQSKKRKKKHKN